MPANGSKTAGTPSAIVAIVSIVAVAIVAWFGIALIWDDLGKSEHLKNVWKSYTYEYDKTY